MQLAVQNHADLQIEPLDRDEYRMKLIGDWRLDGDRQFEPDEVLGERKIQHLSFDSTALGTWDSALVNFLLKLMNVAEERGIEIDRGALPEGAERLIRLATAVPEKDTKREAETGEVFYEIGTAAIGYYRSGLEMLTFIGDAVLAFGKLLVGRANYRKSDLFLTIQECGVLALPIVSLISFLVGLILAFVGAIQLEKFGAEIYVADLVAIAMAREMAPIMTGIIMAGRTGAAFAAQLGTMTVNEEIDALQTLGISPMEFLVLPRMVALGLMMPLLCIFADLVGIIGGIVVGTGMLDITLTQYMNQTQESMGLTHISIGLVKGFVFGGVVALAGCLRGIQCGRSAASVGKATTSAVVTAIVLIIVLDALFAFVTNVLGI